MSFKESDFPVVFSFLYSLCKKAKNPGYFKSVFMEAFKIYKKIPLYPGLVNMCLGQVEKKVMPEEVEPGDQIVFEKDGKEYFGFVESVKGDDVKLIDVVEIKDSMVFSKNEMAKVRKINENTLKELWPSLVFEEEEK